MKYIIILFILLLSVTTYSEPPMLPIAIEIMEELRDSYRDDRGEMYIEEIVKMKNLDSDAEDALRDIVDRFFDSSQFIKTGAAYLTKLFDEKGLEEILSSINNGHLNLNDPNYPSARKLQALFDQLDPYIYKYLKSKS